MKLCLPLLTATAELVLRRRACGDAGSGVDRRRLEFLRTGCRRVAEQRLAVGAGAAQPGEDRGALGR